MAEPTADEHRQRWQAWCKARAASLAVPDSWLGLAGLYLLEAGDNTVGTATDAAVQLPAGPARLGVLRWVGDELSWRPATGEPQPLQTDAGGAPTVVAAGTSAFFVIERDGRRAVRVRDLDWAARQPFAGVDCFAYDPAWRIEAEWRLLDPPQTMEVPNVSGDLKPVRVEWQAVFRVGDTEVALLPMSVSESGAFFVFRDASSGRQTYGAGRFLNTTAPAGGRIVLDFNHAYNPPCAFTAFATCPLPPPENWLAFPVSAGELRYAGAH